MRASRLFFVHARHWVNRQAALRFQASSHGGIVRKQLNHDVQLELAEAWLDPADEAVVRANAESFPNRERKLRPMRPVAIAPFEFRGS